MREEEALSDYGLITTSQHGWSDHVSLDHHLASRRRRPQSHGDDGGVLDHHDDQREYRRRGDGVVGLANARHLSRSSIAFGAGLCLRCGYDLRDSAGRCSECGDAVVTPRR